MYFCFKNSELCVFFSSALKMSENFLFKGHMPYRSVSTSLLCNSGTLEKKGDTVLPFSYKYFKRCSFQTKLLDIATTYHTSPFFDSKFTPSKQYNHSAFSFFWIMYCDVHVSTQFLVIQNHIRHWESLLKIILHCFVDPYTLWIPEEVLLISAVHWTSAIDILKCLYSFFKLSASFLHHTNKLSILYNLNKL